jgi:hypothetical protein
MTYLPPTTNPNATRSGSWCSRYVVAASRLVPVPVDAPLAVAEPLPEWLKRSKPLTPADDPRTPAEVATERHPGLSRLARGLAELMRQQKAEPLPASSPYRAALEQWLGVHKRKPRKPTLAGVAKAATKAAIPVARYEVKPDGTVVVVTGAPTPIEANPWDEVLSNAADKKRPS